ncbi:MAG: acyl-CoA dehydrogenase family protein, partial [Pseudomonadota bacterium]
MTQHPHPRSTDVLEAASTLAADVFDARAATWDRERRYCWDNIDDLRRHGVLGMTLPAELGGRGVDYTKACKVIEEIAGACALTARVVVETNMGAVGAILAYGTEPQKRRAAELVLAGDKPAICITEPSAGSAATDMQTTATPVDGGWRLNGIKHWITGGGISQLHLVFARVLDERGGDLGIGGFIVEADPANGRLHDGFRIARHERTLGLCGMPEAELHFDNVFVSADQVLAPPGGFKRGFAQLMTAYNGQRIGAASVAIGIARGALARAKAYALHREQFGRPIAEFQGLQWMIADMETGVHAAQLMIADAAATRAVDGLPFPEMAAAAKAKLFASETAIRVVDQALQIFGARGYGSEEPLERMYRDVRMFTIGGGTAQVLRTQIAADALGIRTPQTRDGYARGPRSLGGEAPRSMQGMAHSDRATAA